MNFNKILSKNSLRSPTLRHGLNQSEEITKLQNEIETLRQNVSALKLFLESRESAIGILAREKEKAFLDLKSVQRSYIKIQRQLLLEKKMNLKSKECRIDTTKQLSKGSESSDTPSEIDDRYISTLKEEIKSKDQIIISVCSKYLKLKSYKRVLQDKFKTLQTSCGEVCENVLKALREHRGYVDSLLDDLIKNRTTSPSQEEYIKLIKMNNDLQFENTQLKLYQISNIYLGESRDDYSPGPSSQNIQKKSEMNFEETKPIFSKHICCSRFNFPFNILTVSKHHLATNGFDNVHNLRKSISDSDLHRDFYR